MVRTRSSERVLAARTRFEERVLAQIAQDIGKDTLLDPEVGSETAQEEQKPALKRLKTSNKARKPSATSKKREDLFVDSRISTADPEQK